MGRSLRAGIAMATQKLLNCCVNVATVRQTDRHDQHTYSRLTNATKIVKAFKKLSTFMRRSSFK